MMPDAEPEPSPDQNPDPEPEGEPEMPPDPERPPTLLELTPTRGAVAGGTSVLVLGDGFTEDTEVFFATRRLQQVEVISETQILGRTPPGAVGEVDVKVVTEFGDDEIVRGFSYFEPLSVTRVSPFRTPTSGGDVMLVTGSGFSEETLVTVGGRAAIDVDFVDTNTLQIVTPPGEVGRQDVRLTDRNSSALLAGGVVYYQPVEVDRLFPSAGTIEGGNEVTLFGAGFDEETAVRFGEIEIDSTFVDEGQIRVEAPPGVVGFVNITVVNDNGIAGLLEGYYYYERNDDELQVFGIGPASGPAEGGQQVTIVGQNLDGPGLAITLNGNALSIDRVSGDSVLGTTPAGEVGVADLVVSTNAGTVTLENAYQYLPTLAIDSVTPDNGNVSGGDELTIAGSGFNDESIVFFGPQRATILSVEADLIVVLAPPGTVGAVDLEVRDSSQTAVLEEGYTYTQQVNIFGMTPTKGSISGGTFLVFRGQGFTSLPEVSFGINEATNVALLDSSTLTVRTPPGREGAVDVTLVFGDVEIRAPERYTYFNPGSRFGGVWGDSIQGAVNVSVYSTAGSAIENAYVTLSVDRNSPYRGFTNAVGQVTFSGPALTGRQNVTAVAAGFSSATVQSFNAENATVFLSPLDGQGAPPGGPPLGTITGVISGVEKVGDPGPNEYELAIVQTTQVSPFRSNPPTGNGNVVLGNGRYTLQSRVGDVAVIVYAGLFNNLTEEFRPLYMGIRRYLFVSQGETYDIDLEADIPLNAPITFKVTNAPRGTPGPNGNLVIPHLDLGFEGTFGGIDVAEGDSEFVTAEHQPALEGILDDASFFVLGGAWTNGRSPYSLAIMENVVPDGVVELPSLLGVPSPLNPTDGGRVINNYVEFSPNSVELPDFYLVSIEKLDRTPVWDVFLPGNEPYFQLPEFPDFGDLPIDERPAPFVDGMLVLSVTSARAIEFDYDNFEYNDFGLNNWEVFTSNAWLLQLR
jgi:hypothetical protein